MSWTLSLELDDDNDSDVVRTPAGLDVVVGNGGNEEVVTFAISDGTTTWGSLLVDGLDEYGTGDFTVPLPAVPAGAYTMSVTGPSSLAGSLDFTILNDPLSDTPDPGDTAEPVVPTVPDGLWPEEPGIVHWRLFDTSTNSPAAPYTFPRNPKAWTNPLKPNFLEHDVTSAPDGNVLAWQGADRSWTFEFSGYLDTQAEYEALEFWTNLRRRFWLIDHRNRVHYVTFEHFDAKARIVPNKPWAHDYTVKVVHFYRQDLEVGA